MATHLVEEIEADEELRNNLWKLLHENSNFKVSEVIHVTERGTLSSVIVILEQEE